MKKLTDIKGISALLKNDKAVKIIVAAGFALIVLILISDFMSLGGTEKKEEPQITTDAQDYARQLEEQLTAILSEIEGTGRVKLMITLENFSGNPPKVMGAAVVCEGGGNVLVKQKVVETVSKVLGISTARVSVTY